MGTLREMSYHEVVKRLQRLGFRFYREIGVSVDEFMNL